MSAEQREEEKMLLEDRAAKWLNKWMREWENDLDRCCGRGLRGLRLP